MAKRAFLHLDGVTDEWIDKVEVRTAAGGDILPRPDAVTSRNVAASKVGAACCARLVVTN